ncbi:PASTA domain-containing protein [Amycolatopsis sp. DG1A-15b]|uniref:PASTA domain-containing protein n=1 Tax=Amycolatopsis sp. DG1A-15b TaxID=3052846 RepID=UPI00255B8222|nr:PASTA domain-containing protein [Amycolatopsis sp. DG1A-15b]WIX89593.1 PASTA domain-containing protein [Amycolatopsis sp. DG1A-15b]
MVTTLAALAFATAACGTPPGSPGTTTSTTVSTATSTSASAPAKLIKVPDVSGMNHQDAQNAMQRAGLYNLREVDGTGQGRALVIDRNWRQTGQDPAPGTEVPADAVITLTAVKYDDR